MKSDPIKLLHPPFAQKRKRKKPFDRCDFSLHVVYMIALVFGCSFYYFSVAIASPFV